MIALYRAAVERAPDDPALAVALGRVFFELEMLDEAADQFEKVEVRAPDLPAVHAFLGAVFERRGETRDAFEEYRRALRLAGSYDWPQRCVRCGATVPSWRARCAQCGRWNTFRPVDGR
jgi:Flp pilus assembly protein TadD